MDEPRPKDFSLAYNAADLQRENAELRAVLEGIPLATVFLDGNKVVRNHTPASTSLFDFTETDRGRSIADIAHRLADVDLDQDVSRVLEQRCSIERTVRLRNSDAFYLMRIVPSPARENGALITFVEVTALVAAEEKQRVLVSELNHRVRNMLQVVMGLANQTLHKSQDLKQFGKAFVGRMQALARAYELLSRDGWRKVPVVDLLRTQLSGFATDGARYSAEGDDFVLTANAALSLGLVLYELATNAMKYGALSSPTGHVNVRWECTARDDGIAEFILRWEESGGPAVKPPTRQGFGTELVQRQLKYELGGLATLDFNESGLIVTLAIPAKEAIESVDMTGTAQCL